MLATLMGDDIQREVACKVVKGLLDTPGKLGYVDDDSIDGIVPDYAILEEIDYKYPATNAYITYVTRGCIRKCPFCAVHRIEPEFRHYSSIKEQVDEISSRYGAKKDLLLLDNNVLASDRFADIIAEIKSLGFERGATFSYNSKGGRTVTAQRYVDFNQGLDGRLLTEEKMALLSEIAIRPLRIAFDDIAYKDLYIENVRLAAKYGITHLSNYVLFNYLDTPDDFYERLKINIRLNEELGLRIFSFPMRYVDLKSKNRLVDTPGNLGKNWTKKQLRSIQCILHATHGVVGAKRPFFEKAFGQDIQEFNKIALMPEDYIMHRYRHEDDGSVDRWWQQLNDLSTQDKEEALSIVLSNDFRKIPYIYSSTPVMQFLEHYLVGYEKQLNLFADAQLGDRTADFVIRDKVSLNNQVGDLQSPTYIH
ncbi:MAG: radical SAM protein [Armatimonadetes bacterium]|nr:radical SAM protein [Armatimonadota bacterium]